MGLMMLGAGPGSTILVQATGKQAREALDAITDAGQTGFDEDNEGVGAVVRAGTPTAACRCTICAKLPISWVRRDCSMRQNAGNLGWPRRLPWRFRQFPEYAQQYTQRLGGAVDELRDHRRRFRRRRAARSGLNRRRRRCSATIPRRMSSWSAAATRCAATLARYAQLSADLGDLQGAGPLQRLRILPNYLDSDIGARALADFKPAVPVTAEGFSCGPVAGLCFGYLVDLGAVFASSRCRSAGSRGARDVEDIKFSLYPVDPCATCHV